MCFNYVELFLLIMAATLLEQISSVYGSGVEFGYGYYDGPNRWSSVFPQCSDNGINSRQSPINVVTKKTKPFPFTPIEIPQTPITYATITNNGHSVVITIVNENEKPIITGGPLYDHMFKLEQIHFHWGNTDQLGSENKIDDKASDMEMHIVFYNLKYGSFKEATSEYQKQKDALVVLGVFINASNRHNDLFNFTDALFNIQYTANPQISYNFWKYFHEFLPHDTDRYFTFAGSLTTPPCTEHVTWILFWTPINISYQQMDFFRQIRDNHGISILRNNRFLQRVNRRLLRYPRQHIASIYRYNNRKLPAQIKNRRHLPNGNLSQTLVNSMNITPAGYHPMYQYNVPNRSFNSNNMNMNMMPAYPPIFGH